MSESVNNSVPTTAAPASQTTASESAPKTQAAPTAAEVRKLKLKLEGGEVELPESEVIALAQQGKVAQKRFQEAAATKKQAEELITYLKNNPKEAIQKLGIDVRKFSEEYLMEVLQQEAMSPEQKRVAEMEAKLKKYETEKKQAEEAARQQEMRALEEKHLKSYNEMFVKALTESGLPRTPYTVKRMAELTLVANKKGLNLDASQIAKLVREDYQAEMQSLYGSADGSQLMALLGDDGVKKLTKVQVAQLKSKPQEFAKPIPKNTDSKKNSKPVDAFKEFQRENRRLRFRS